MNRYKLVLSSIFIILSIFHESKGQADKTEQDLRAIMNQLDMAGLSVAVVKKGEIFFML